MGIKEDILMAGSMLLREKGVTALTQPQIAQAANIKQSHLTYYFPKRSDLVLAIAEFTLASLIANVSAQIAAKPQGQTLVDAVAKLMIEGLPPRVFLGLIVAADNDPEIRKVLRKLVKHVRKIMLEQLQQAGITANDETARLFHATIIGLAVMHQARQNKESAAEVRVGLENLLCLLAPKSTKKELA